MKLVTFLAALLLSIGSAHAQLFIGGGQFAGASSTSSAGAVGGSGAVLLGIAGQESSATGSNISGAQVIQTPGQTTVITESLSGATQSSLSGALGFAGATGGSGATADGSAIGGGGQIGGICLGC